MKRILILVLMISAVFCFLAPTAFAERDPCEHRLLGKILNECDDDLNTHADRDNPYGGGLDFFLLRYDRFDVTSETRWDHPNQELSTYAVVQIKSDTGLLQKVWGFTFGRLFNGSE